MTEKVSKTQPLEWLALADRVEKYITSQKPVTRIHHLGDIAQGLNKRRGNEGNVVGEGNIIHAIKQDMALRREKGVEPRFGLKNPYGGSDYVYLLNLSENNDGSKDLGRNIRDKNSQNLHDLSKNAQPSAVVQAIKDASSYDLEMIVARLLTAMGMKNVVCTPPTRDGGIDIRSTMSLDDFVQIRIAIQVKKYTGSVHSPDVQKLRGSLDVSERGIFVTSGYFSTGAIAEANHQNKPAISLVDGDVLRMLLVKYGLYGS